MKGSPLNAFPMAVMTDSPFFLTVEIYPRTLQKLDPGFPVIHNEPDQSASLSSSKSQSLLKIKAIDLHIVMCYT